MTLKEQIYTATDMLNTLRRIYFQQQTDYETIAAAARHVLELRQQAEKAFGGKVKTKITPQTIASLIRAP